MATSSASARDRANFLGGGLCSKNAASAQLTRQLSEMAERVFAKPYRALVDYLQISERDAHYRLSASRKYDAVDIARLLQTEEGIRFLVVLMDQARPKWWRAIISMGVMGSVAQRRRADLKLMRRVFDADQSAVAAFSDSFRAQDEDFYRTVLSGFGEATAPGRDHRAVGPQPNKR